MRWAWQTAGPPHHPDYNLEQLMTCKCGAGTVWFDHKAKKWKGCACGKVKGQS